MLPCMARVGLLFVLLVPSALSALNYGSGNLQSEFLQLWDDSDDLEVVRRALDIPGSSWPMWHPARRHLRNWSSDTRKRYLPYHPVVRFRSPKPDFGDYPILGYARRYEDPLKKDLSAAEVLAILSTIMVDRASQGRLKGLRFGISKR